MRIPRDLSGDELIRRLKEFGYAPTRQTGSHVRLSRTFEGATTHVTVPRHGALRVGTLNAILSEVAHQLGVTKNYLIRRLG